jgi:hypothetical protein
VNLATRLIRHLRRPDLTRPTPVAKRSLLPNPLPARCLYVLGDPPQWAKFNCPCGTGHDIMLRIDDAGSWRLTTSRWRRRPTVRPSVDAEGPGGRRCHYWITNGRVSWVPDSDIGTQVRPSAEQ